MVPRTGPDPTSWLPADYTPSPNRRIVQRRPNLRRLPKWGVRQAGAAPGLDRPLVTRSQTRNSWSGPSGRRKSRTNRASVARALRNCLTGLVASRAASVPWRAIYRELKRLEFRGEVRRGYFVKGLVGPVRLPDASNGFARLQRGSRREFVVMARATPRISTTCRWSSSIATHCRDLVARGVL